MEDDSPWVDDIDQVVNIPQTQIADQEWKKLQSRYNDAGYAEGITAGKQSQLQDGFDQGFANVVPYAREVGFLRGVSSTLLALLTTKAGTKNAPTLVEKLGDDKESILADCRALVTALGKLSEASIMPVDQEAAEHARSHGDEGLSQVMQDRQDMRILESMLGGLPTAPKPSLSTIADCRLDLERLLLACGLSSVLS